MIIAMPAYPAAPAEIPWKLSQPSQSTRGEFGGTTRATILPQAPRWTCEITMPPIQGEVTFRPWRSFLARLQGKVNSFRLVACEGPQLQLLQTIVVDGAGQTGGILHTRGWRQGGQLLDGMFVSVGGRLLQVVADTVLAGADGRLDIAVLPILPEGLADGAPVEVHRPFALLRSTTDEPGWTVSPGQRYAVSLSCEEAF